jgi:hypothetical protein
MEMHSRKKRREERRFETKTVHKEKKEKISKSIEKGKKDI